MLVECITEDFSDPEAVSGSSTTIRIRIRHLGGFSFFARPKTRSKEESTNLADSICELRFAYLGIFSCFARLETHSQEENTYLDNFLLQMKTPILTILIFNSSKEESTNLADSICELRFAHLGVFILFDLVKKEKQWSFSLEKSEGSTTASKVEPSVLWSVELYFGSNVCFWLLYKICMQKLLL